MPLPAEIIDLVWAKLATTYGHRFLSIWEGFPEETVKADWALILEDVREDRILWALENLPARAPDAPSFKQLCTQMPQYREPLFPGLPPGKKAPTPQFVRAVAARIHEETDTKESKAVAWARNFVAKFGEEGLSLRAEQRDDLRRARRILEVHQADLELAKRKAEAQERVDAAAQEADRVD